VPEGGRRTEPSLVPADLQLGHDALHHLWVMFSVSQVFQTLDSKTWSVVTRAHVPDVGTSCSVMLSHAQPKNDTPAARPTGS
jgi:hypothetical protein